MTTLLPSSSVSGGQDDYLRAAKRALRKEQFRTGHVRSRPPDLLSDFIFYLRNNHVLLFAFVAHPEHPYPLKRRQLLLLNTFGFALFVACLAQSLGGAGAEARDAEQLKAVLGEPVVALLRDFPTTLSVLLQLLWDVPGASMGVCHCAKDAPDGPRPCQTLCGRGQILCYVCHLSWWPVVYAATAAILLFVFAQVLNIVDLGDVLLLLLTSKALAFLFAIPTSALIFAWLWQCEAVRPTNPTNGHHTGQGHGDLV
jgi:hypothetical protein